MRTLVFLLEELSAKVLLQGFLPKVLPKGVEAKYLVFEGKQDLEKQLLRKLKGWRLPNSAFIVIRDQDAGECIQVKQRLAELAEKSGKSVLIRVACRELESWVLGDLEAVASAFERPAIARHARVQKYRNPDSLVRPVGELRQILSAYQKVDGARRIGPLLDPSRNASKSFKVFCSGLERLLKESHQG